MTLDLHGHTLHNAWKLYLSTTQDQYWKEKKYIIVITGIGEMNLQFHHWVINDQYATKYEKMNDGAWKVHIKKKPTIRECEREKELNLRGLLKKYSK